MDAYPPNPQPVRRLYVTEVVAFEKQWERAQELATLGNRVWFHVHPSDTPCNDKCKYLEG